VHIVAKRSFELFCFSHEWYQRRVQCSCKMEESQSDIEEGDLDADNSWNSYKGVSSKEKEIERQ